MNNEKRNHRFDYIELPAGDAEQLARAKRFYSAVFGWTYKDWGSEYADTPESGVASGINADAKQRPPHPLAILYAIDLDATRAAVEVAGGKVVAEYSFPGGRRFHFKDPAGNELAVWSEA
jgi:predicted enzyme related to lactoylglutathione lyase